jgi:hypothetical protein
MSVPSAGPPVARTVVFISKATPSDDEFALWLAPRLEAAGYSVFADIVTLEPGDRWRKLITNTLQTGAIKMLLCCRDSTLQRDNVQEEIGIALDLAKQLLDPKFIIPLRLDNYKKVLGIGELQYIDFVRGWAYGLGKLLDTLKRQKVPSDPAKIQINPNWEIYRRRSAIPIKDEPERLTSNWLRMIEAPDMIRYFEPTGAVDRVALARVCAASRYPAEPQLHGFFSFATEDEINDGFAAVGKFAVKRETGLISFIEDGLEACDLKKQDASNMVHSILRQAWDRYCRDRGLLEYRYSGSIGFHASKDLAKIGQRIPWARQGEQRSSMLRNVAKGYVWQFGVTALPAFWPFPHFKLKSRVLFAPLVGKEAGNPLDDPRKQHRLRRTVCKGWRNKQWHGRMLAFLELLLADAPYLSLPLAPTAHIRLEPSPMLFSSPVSTFLPDQLADEQEELDDSTLGRAEPEEEP